jgi:lipopolysaccharide exporter
MVSEQSQPQKKALGKVAKRGVIWSFLREGVTEILLFPASMVVSRILTPAEFGITSAAMFFIQLSSRLTDLGFNAALVRSKTVTQDHLSSVFVINVAVGVLAYAVLALSAPFIGAFYKTPEAGQVLPIAALGFLFAPLGAVPGALIARDMRFREASIVDWSYCITFGGLSILLTWMGFSFWGIVYARVASVAAQAFTRVYFARWRPSLRFSGPALREVLSFGLGMHTRRLLEYTASNFDNLVVGKFMGMHSLGLYDKAYSTVGRFLNRVNTGGPGVMFRIFALIHEDPARFRRAYSRVIMSATVFGFPLLALMIVTAEQFIVVLFGPQWRPAAVPFQLLCLAGALKLPNAYVSSAAQAAGWVWSEVWRQVLFIALIVSGIYLLRNWGPAGAAFAVLIATAAMTVLMHALLRRVSPLTWGQIVEPLVPGLLCALVVSAMALLVGYLLNASVGTPREWLLLLCQGIGAAVAFLLFVLFAPHSGLRSLVHEMTTDLAPAFLKKQPWLQRYIQLNAGYAESTTS